MTRTENNSGIILTDAQIARVNEVITNTKRRSAWDRGVQAFALDLLEKYQEIAHWTEREKGSRPALSEQTLLNGAEDWTQYSYGGCALIYDADIVRALYPQSVVRRKVRDHGALPPSNGTWLGKQALALRQAARMLRMTAISVVNESNKPSGRL